MKNILITGGSGQLGSSLIRLLRCDSDKYRVICPSSSELDITDVDSVNGFFAKSATIDVTVNCAAYTAVDKAEAEVDAATRLNADAPAMLAEAAVRHHCKFLHISTDYVFDGHADTPIAETAQTAPRSVYGKTKLQGEVNLLGVCKDAVIVRTSWLYSEYRNNFVKTMLRLGQERENLTVVCDQVGTPTYAGDLAKAILSIIEAEKWMPGTYHFSNEGVASWYDFAKAIFELSATQGCTIRPCLSDGYPTPAERPHFSVLDKGKIKRTFGIDIPYWRDSLKVCINNLMNKN